MRRLRLYFILALTMLLAGCAGPSTIPMEEKTPRSEASSAPIATAATTEQNNSMTASGYRQISMADLAGALAKEQNAILLDVRTPEEYNGGYIPGAINLPSQSITAETAAAMLPDKNQPIYVYCRSGNRSRAASEALVRLGYTNITESGGIMDWTGELTPGN